MLDRLTRWLGFGDAPIEPVPLADVADALARERASHVLGAAVFDAGELYVAHPPRIEHANKRLVLELATRGGVSGELSVERYGAIPLPERFAPFAPALEVVTRPGFFDYAAEDERETWVMNFAHHELFCAYGDAMFAQDEIQVAEHPALGALREHMATRSDGLRPATVEGGAPTPVLIRGAQRTIAVDTRRIYGARFGGAAAETVRASVTALDPPPRSNLLAIEAPIPEGHRIYVRGEVEAALATAYAGCRALVLSAGARPVALHTGNWGCGAYGGNRQLMLTVQLMAARLAGLSRLVVYCGADREDEVARFDRELASRFGFRSGARVADVVDRLVAAAFPWGTPDGN